MMQKAEKVRAFLIRYQDRVLYGTDNVLYPLLQHDNFMIEDR